MVHVMDPYLFSWLICSPEIPTQTSGELWRSLRRSTWWMLGWSERWEPPKSHILRWKIIQIYTTWKPQGQSFINIYKWLFKLDDEPNLYIENGCFTISIHKKKWLALGFQETIRPWLHGKRVELFKKTCREEPETTILYNNKWLGYQYWTMIPYKCLP